MSERSLIYKKDSNSPSTLPRGTPKIFILNGELLVDKVEFGPISCTSTNCKPLDKYDLSHDGSGPLIPYCSYFCNSNPYETQSKALDISKISLALLISY